MTPAELYQAHLMSLILQRDDLIERLAEVNEQIVQFKKENLGV
jgi:hypothetical protein